MSKVNALYHIVFCTKHRELTIPEALKNDLYRFIWSIIKDTNCKLLRIGGIPNHIHMLVSLHPSIALSDLMRLIKTNTSNWMNNNPQFMHFQGWASEYFATTVSPESKDKVINYIMNQEEHHLHKPFDQELDEVFEAALLTLHPNDLK